MMQIPTHNFHIRHGNTGTIENAAGIQFTFTVPDGNGGQEPEDLAGTVFKFFTAEAGGSTIIKDSDTGDVDVDIPTGTVTIPISLTESRLFPPMEVPYELEYRLGLAQRTRCEGKLIISKGLNDD